MMSYRTAMEIEQVLQASLPLSDAGGNIWLNMKRRAQARRAMLREWVPDFMLQLAMEESITLDAIELAEQWDMTPEWVAERVALFFLENPDWRPCRLW